MGGFILTKIKAKYIGPDDSEYKNGEIYSIFSIKEIPDGSVIAAENAYGEAYAMPANLFEPVGN
jgi:hypothetical protein